MYNIANILKFYEGAISYETAMNMSFNELMRWHRYAAKINAEIERSIKDK